VAAAFALRKPGEVGPVTRTRAGYNVIQFQEREAPRLRPFDDVKGDIFAKVRRDVIEDARKAYMAKMIKDPPARANEALIEKINREARAAAAASEGTAPGKP